MRRLLFPFSIFLLVGATHLPLAVASTSPEETVRCSPTIVRDYADPLRGLPRIRRVPASGELPFGPSDLRLERLSDSVVIGPSRFGYELVAQRGSVTKRLVLGWTVEMRLSKIDAGGQRVGSVAAATKRVDTVASPTFNGQELALTTPKRPGRYILEISFKRGGSLLQAYAEYLQILRPTVNARLVTSFSAIAPGKIAYFRIENFGTRSIGLIGEDFAFERFESGRWVLDPGSPKGFPGLRLGTLPAGHAGFCRTFTIPTDTPAGLYRLAKTVLVDGEGKRRLSIAAEFQVVP